MAYIGSSASPLPVNFSAVQGQSFSGTGAQVAFTLNRSVASPVAIEVLVNNVQQSPYDGSFTVSGSTLTFSEAPSAGTNNVYVVYRDQALGSLTDTGAVRKTGDTMTGDLGVGATPFARLHATKAGAEVARFTNSQSNGGDWEFKIGGGGFEDRKFMLTDKFGGSDNVRMSLDSAGRVTMPYQPAFWGMSGSVTSGYFTNFVGDLGAHWLKPGLTNRGGHFNVSTGVFTAPVSGAYMISCGIHSGAAGRKILELVKNGVFAGEVCEAAGDYEDQTTALVITLNAGDYLAIKQNLSFAAFNASFGGYLLG